MAMPEGGGAGQAPEIDREGIAWLNVDRPLSLARLSGKLVVLGFWTACSLSCLQVLETLRRVAAAFPREAAVIGVHSPKFPAERELARLRRAIARCDIAHPVAHDPDFQLWRDYAVSAWPTLVLVSPDGKVLGQISGEPDLERLLTTVSELVETWDSRGVLRPSPLRTTPEHEAGGAFRFPGKLKPVPGRVRRWALADAGHHQVVLLDDDGLELARFGVGEAGFADGPAEAAAFRTPQGLVAEPAAVHVADTGNHAVRRIDLDGGGVTTLAGTGERGMVLEENEPALATALASPWDLETDGERLYVANAGTHQIAVLDAAHRRLSRLAGNGMADVVDGPAGEAQLAQPSALALDAAARTLYFVDAETSAVRALALDGEARVRTLVGRGLFDFGRFDGHFEEALLQYPLALARWNGRLLVADSYNDCPRVLDLATRRVGPLDDGRLDEDEAWAAPAEPAGIWAAGADRVLLVDTGHHRILEYRRSGRRWRTWAG